MDPLTGISALRVQEFVAGSYTYKNFRKESSPVAIVPL